MLIDSHAHLEMKDYSKDLDEVLERALEGGIKRIVSIGTDLKSSYQALELANRYDFIFSSVGYHPHNAEEADAGQLKELLSLASEPKVVAWGEIGLDFFRDLSPREKQREVFEQQLDMAMDIGKPVIIHDREAHNEIYDSISGKTKKGHKGVIHCFSGDYDLAIKFIEKGYFISIPGTVTYKNAAQVQDVASRIPVNRMLVETDAPYLAPVPKRGKRNEPLFVTYTAKKIAELRGIDFEEVAHATTENAKRLFGIK